MTDEAKLRQDSDRGERAKRILENDLFQEAVRKARDDILNEMEQTRWDEKERREFLDKELRALKRVVAYVKTVLINGDAATKQLHEPSKVARMYGRR